MTQPCPSPPNPDASGRHLVVVGNGMVGHRLVASLLGRESPRSWRITIFGEEPRPAYDRVSLSSYFSGRSADDLLLDTRVYDDPRVTLHTGTAVAAVDRKRRTVATRCGRTVRYDALVLATGSRPFIPPVPGHDAPGCFAYRTIEDLDAIASYASGKRCGVVVGGGLLGLEAANALRNLDLATHVVEAAPRLMPRQVDEGGAEMLRRHVAALGLTVHVDTTMTRIEAPARVVLTGDHTLDSDIVVFSAGVRPRDELARAAGLAVGERGGITVDRHCRTDDPAIFAIGECAHIAGQVYGLVGPGYAMAEVVAEQLAGGGTAEFTGADTSTKLKLLGVDVASFGNPFAPGALDVTYADTARGVYQKLVVTEDARTLLGGILVGDASAYPVLRPRVGAPLGEPPERLLFGAADPAGTAGLDGLPADALVCSCNSVTKQRIRTAVTEQECADVGAVKAATRAGTGCGSCVPLVKKILDAELAAAGITVSKAMCEHFDHTRAELFDIVAGARITTFSELVTRYGRGRGCDICKPAVASILATLGNGHILAGEQAALQDTNDHFLANLQRNGTYSVVPRLPGGEVTPAKLIVIGEIARDFGLYTKITGGQRIDMFGARVEQLPAIWRRLVDAGFESGHAYGKALRTVKSCVGSTWCRYGVQDSVGMAIRLELRYRGLRSPHKIKAAVSGCARECAEARGKDFGVIATERGWNLYVGGNGGFAPRHADLLAADLDAETLIRTIDRFLAFYVRTADRLQRTASWLEALAAEHGDGLGYLREVIIDDRLGIGADLDAMMARHTENYVDEWRATLDDPESLRRFVSFVNAPELPDPSISFEVERDQIKPVLVAGAELEVVSR